MSRPGRDVFSGSGGLQCAGWYAIQVAHHEGTGQGGVVLVSSYTAFNHPVDFVCVLSRSVMSNSLLPHAL